MRVPTDRACSKCLQSNSQQFGSSSHEEFMLQQRRDQPISIRHRCWDLLVGAEYVNGWDELGTDLHEIFGDFVQDIVLLRFHEMEQCIVSFVAKHRAVK